MKKILLTLLTLSLLLCAFVVCASAERVEDYDDTFELKYETIIPHYEKWSYNDGKSFVRKKYEDLVTISFISESGEAITEVPMWEYDEAEGKYYSLVWYISDYTLTWEDQIYTDANVGDQVYPKYTSAVYTLSKARAVDLRYVINNYNTTHNSWVDADGNKITYNLKSLKGIYHTNGTPDDTSDDIKLQHAVGIGRDNDNYGYYGYDAQFAATGNKIVVGNFRDCDFERDEEGNYGTSNTWSGANNAQCIWLPDTMKYMCAGQLPYTYEFDIGDGVEIIACQILRENKKIKNFVIPNSVIFLNNEAFRGSDLTSLTIGEGLITHGGSPFLYTGGADNVYISVNALTKLQSAINKLIENKNATIYFDGDFDEATALMNKIISADSNYKITLVDYKTTTERGDVKNVCLFYNYNRCDAFYRGDHQNATTYGFSGEKYVSEYCKFEGCVNCDNKQTTSYGKLIINKGYSTENMGDGFSFGITFNKEAIALYEEKAGTTFNYGFVAGKITEGDSGLIVNANGEKATDNVFTTLFTNTEYELFTVKVTGIDNDEFKAKDIYCSAFIIDGAEIFYLGDTVTSAAVPVSYNKLLESESVTEEE